MGRQEVERLFSSWRQGGRLPSGTNTEPSPDGGEPTSTAWLGCNRMGHRQAPRGGSRAPPEGGRQAREACDLTVWAKGPMTSPGGRGGARPSKLFMEQASRQPRQLLSCFRCGWDRASSAGEADEKGRRLEGAASRWGGRAPEGLTEGWGRDPWAATRLLRGVCPCVSTLALEEPGLCSPPPGALVQNSGSRGAQKAPPGGFTLSASVHTGVWAPQAWLPLVPPDPRQLRLLAPCMRCSDAHACR